jgi:hypothetical protein
VLDSLGARRGARGLGRRGPLENLRGGWLLGEQLDARRRDDVRRVRDNAWQSYGQVAHSGPRASDLGLRGQDDSSEGDGLDGTRAHDLGRYSGGVQSGGEDQGEQESFHALAWPSASRWPRLSVQAEANALVSRGRAVRFDHPGAVAVEKIITRLNTDLPLGVEQQDISVGHVQAEGAR